MGYFRICKFTGISATVRRLDPRRASVLLRYLGGLFTGLLQCLFALRCWVGICVAVVENASERGFYFLF